VIFLCVYYVCAAFFCEINIYIYIYIYIYIKRRVVVAITCMFDLFDHCTVNACTTAELTVQYYREDESIVMRMMMMTMRVVHTRR